MGAIKDAIAKTAKKWLLNEQGEISLTKISAEIGGLAGTIVALPHALATAGITSIVIPSWLVAGATLVTILSASGILVGGRNAMNKK